MNSTVDLNTDIGEGFGRYTVADDEELVKLVSSVNVACGFHAGDSMIMDNIVELASAQGVSVGAHPSFDDFRGFGRRKMDVSPLEITNDVLYQLGALNAFTKSHKINLEHVSPHGQLGHACIQEGSVAEAFVEAVEKFDRNLTIFTQDGELFDRALQKGLNVRKQIFADRAYDDEGKLVSRKIEGSVIHDIDVIIKRCAQMIQHQTVTTISGNEIKVSGDVLVVHSDTPGSTKIVESLIEGFKEYGIDIKNR